jgi:hypothetical protein
MHDPKGGDMAGANVGGAQDEDNYNASVRSSHALDSSDRTRRNSSSFNNMKGPKGTFGNTKKKVHFKSKVKVREVKLLSEL